MKQPCGCCSGIEIVTPQSEANRPGLPALVYRVGTYATFFKTMLARISNFYLDVTADNGSGTVQRLRPLSALTTRALTDPSIALFDAWATVADVLTFYQERIANEGFLRTATERRSVHELARLVGYKLRPGISAGVYLAFTVTAGFDGIIPAGTRAQSIPGVGQTPQFFEAYEDLPAQDVWNNLAPRLTRPQVITLAADYGTDAATRDTIYFDGISTSLKTGDALLFVFGNGDGQQVLRTAKAVEVQADEGRTEVTLVEPPPQLDGSVTDLVTTVLQPFVSDASSIFADSDLGTQVATVLTGLVANAPTATTGQAAADMVSAAIPQIQQMHDVAEKRNFTRLEPWLSDINEALNDLVEALGQEHEVVGSGSAQAIPRIIASSPLENIYSILDPLEKKPSLQPANSLRLTRAVSQAFSPASDLAPRLLATFHPAASQTLYKAWSGIETATAQVTANAMRVKGGLFGSNSNGLPQYTNNRLTGFIPPCLSNCWSSLIDDSENLTGFALDVTSDKIVRGSWVAIDRFVFTVDASDHTTTYHRVTDVKTASMATEGGFTGKSIQLTLDPPWLSDLASTSDALQSEDLLRGTIVYAQSEKLDLAEEPLDVDVEGDTIELAQIYDGLDSGRWIIVSGERTDIPNTTGVTASELVMVSSVTQGSRAPLCATFPSFLVPPAGTFFFSQIYYTTDPNTLGDRLIVGELAVDPKVLSQIPLPNELNQQYCDQAQLAAGTYANAYVLSAAERDGDFSAFEGLLVDPQSQQPYPGGQLSPQKGSVFAWRISTQPAHTILQLANTLAYTYDSSTVTIYGNVVKATHGQTQGEVLGDGDSSEALQTFQLHQAPLTFLPVPTPSGAESTLVVRVNEVEWEEADNLFILGPTDREYITQTDDSGTTTVTTGDGQHGLRLPTGTANVKAVYRSGTGQVGNVDAQQISQLATQPLGVKSVINPLAAAGGADGDTRDQARRNIPIGTLALDRLVSVSDYADFARKFAGIGKASSRRLSDGRKLVVHLTIAGKDDIAIDPTTDLYQALQQALLQAGDPYQPLQIALRRLKVLVMSASVKVLPDYTWETVAANLRSTLLALYSFDNRELGQAAFLSEAVSAMQAVAGVQYVNMQVFDSVAESVTAAQLASLAATLTLRSLVDAELARVDPTATDPAQRILPAEVAILTPDIPDTLILTEITT